METGWKGRGYIKEGSSMHLFKLRAEENAMQSLLQVHLHARGQKDQKPTGEWDIAVCEWLKRDTVATKSDTIAIERCEENPVLDTPRIDVIQSKMPITTIT